VLANQNFQGNSRWQACSHASHFLREAKKPGECAVLGSTVLKCGKRKKRKGEHKVVKAEEKQEKCEKKVVGRSDDANKRTPATNASRETQEKFKKPSSRKLENVGDPKKNPLIYSQAGMEKQSDSAGTLADETKKEKGLEQGA